VPQPKTSLVPTDRTQLEKLLDRAQKGDTSTLPAVREMLQTPTVVDAFGGNLAQQAELSLVNAAAGDNLVFREALTRKLELIRAELAGPSPTPLERLLVDRIVTCWLQLSDADVRAAQAKDLSPAWAEFYQRRMDRAHRRYLSAIKTLATVRRLALPVLIGQVNIASKQVNVAAAVAGSAPDRPPIADHNAAK
jgi:hypothetical protein